MEQKKTQTGSTVKVKERVMEPRQYLVVIHNDDVTTMDFVVMILMKYFRKSEHDAQVIMMKVHMEGKGIAGRYSYDIAQTKTQQATKEARDNGFPLLLTVEPETD